MYQLDLTEFKKQMDYLNSNGYTTLSLAYPYGVYDLNTVTVLKKLGFKLAFTVNSGLSDSSNNRYAIPRIIMSQYDTMASFIRKVNTGK